MEKELIISVVMLLVILFGSIYSLVLIKDCKKILKSMQRRSKKYMKEGVK